MLKRGQAAKIIKKWVETKRNSSKLDFISIKLKMSNLQAWNPHAEEPVFVNKKILNNNPSS